jgi:hypothetical protein
LGFSLKDLDSGDIYDLNRPRNCLNDIVELKLNFVGSHLHLKNLREFTEQLRSVQKLYLAVYDVNRYCLRSLRQILQYIDHLEELEVHATSSNLSIKRNPAEEISAVVRDYCLHLKTLNVPLKLLEQTRSRFEDALVVEESKEIDDF